MGTLTGFAAPYGQCTDKSGNVFITQFEASEVTEYAHGGTNPTKTLDTPGVNPVGCSVDPKTGNLAVANFISDNYPGGILVFAHATGTPKEYQAPGMYYYFPQPTTIAATSLSRLKGLVRAEPPPSNFPAVATRLNRFTLT